MKLLTPKPERDLNRREADAQREIQEAEAGLKELTAALADAKLRHSNAQHAILGLQYERNEIKRQANEKIEAAARAKRRAEAVAESLKPYDAEIARLTEERGRHNSEGNVAGVAALDVMIQQKKDRRQELAQA